MKRVLCMMLALFLAVGLFGCHFGESSDMIEPVEFFYPRKPDHYAYGAEDGVFAAEIREASGHTGDLNYLISMYLYGPQDATLRSPFPAGCKLEIVRFEEDTLYLVLSSQFAELEYPDLTVACASLTKTCLSMTDARQVCINSTSASKTISITMDAASLLMSDYSAFEVQPITE